VDLDVPAFELRHIKEDNIKPLMVLLAHVGRKLRIEYIQNENLE